MADNSRVEVSKTLLGLLGGGLLACLLALAFLLGRQSAPAPTPVAAVPPPTRVELDQPKRVELTNFPPPPPPQAPVAQAPVQAPPAQAPAAQEPAAAPAAQAPEVAAAAPPAATPVPYRPRPRPRTRPNYQRPTPPTAAAPAVAPGNPAVAAYLAKVDAITAQAGQLGDPNQMANDLLQNSVNGDTSGLDNLANKARTALAQLKSVVPPTVAKEHYQLLISQTQAGLQIIDQLKTSIKSGDMGALTAISARGQQLQAQAQRLDELTKQLKAQ